MTIKINLLIALLLMMPVLTWAQSTSKSTSKSSAKSTVKSTAKSSTKSSAKSTTKSTANETDAKIKTNKNLTLEIDKLDILEERTPVAKGSKHGSKGSGAKWLCVRAQIKVSKQEWLDEFEARWSVLADGGSKVKPILMQLNTKFTDLEKGKNYITAHVSPTFFKKYFDTESVNKSRISAKLDIVVNGKVMATKEKGSKASLIATPDKCRLDNSSLQPRSKTPFKDADADYYANEKIE